VRHDNLAGHGSEFAVDILKKLRVNCCKVLKSLKLPNPVEKNHAHTTHVTLGFLNRSKKSLNYSSQAPAHKRVARHQQPIKHHPRRDNLVASIFLFSLIKMIIKNQNNFLLYQFVQTHIN
jgi:hypothetical protein